MAAGKRKRFTGCFAFTGAPANTDVFWRTSAAGGNRQPAGAV
jgi:hypothetical protein